MQYISKAEEWAINLYPNEESNNYKLSDYTIVSKYNDGYIIFNTITWSLYFLNESEYKEILTNNLLIKNKVVIPDNIDESEIAINSFLKRAEKKINPYDFINGYVILTTNECNARCFYCYEKEKKGNMSIETGEKLVQFIKEHHRKKVDITWFGGEPLKNVVIIDYICSRLNEENVNFSTSMISNTSLFTNEILEKAKNLWNLKKLQVTFDGPEFFYNKIKNYEDIKDSAFKIVFDNINNILKNSNIKIDIRINLTHENIDYIEELINYIENNIYKEKPDNYNYYYEIIFQIANNLNLLKKDDFDKKVAKLNEKYFQDSSKNFVKKRNLIRCMCDRCAGVAVTPEGILHNCEHIMPENIIGNLDDGITNQNLIKWVLNKSDEDKIKICKENKCKLLPVCEKTHFCPPSSRCDNIEIMNYQNEFFIKRLEKTVDLYFKKLKELKK